MHENVCKGPQKKLQNGFAEERRKNEEVVRKSKENFFKMVHELKGNKMHESQIDRQLDQELATIDKEPKQSKHKVEKVLREEA